MATIPEAIQIGLAHQRAGRFEQAEQIYRQILQADPRHPGASHLLGLMASRAGKHEVAVQLISQAIRQDGAQAVFHAGLAEAYRGLGRLDEATACYRQALRIQPNLAEASNNLGTILQAQGRTADAMACYSQAIASKPHYADAHNNLGTAYHDQAQWESAIACYRRAAEVDPRYAKAHYNIGIALQAQNQWTEAEAAFRNAVGLDHGSAEAHYSLAVVLQKQQRWAEAEVAFRQALRLRPAFAEAHSSLGAVYQAQGRLSEALGCYQDALRIEPEYPEAYYNWGTLLKDQKRFDESLAKYRRAIELMPDFTEAHYSLGAALQQLGRIEEAIAAYRTALRLRPDFALAHNNLGNAHQTLGESDLALACYAQALEIDSRPAGTPARMVTTLFEESIASEAHYNRALVYLSRGQFLEGWTEFEWRLKCKTYPIRTFSRPPWDGSSFAGRTLLVHAEQGFGDTLHFARYLPLVRERGGTVRFAVQPSLLPLLRCSGFDGLTAWSDDLGEFDLHVPLLNLPGIFRTTLENMPADVPYLAADPRLIEMWREKLSSFAGLKVGIHWQGNRDYVQDRYRSIPLARFAPLAGVPGVRLFSLQKFDGVEQLAELAGEFEIHDLGPRLDGQSGAFMDTAAAMKNLDLVITSDTATPHLAGALGVPVWVALSKVPEWRWLLDRRDSPWYPTMRLFRQSQFGQWRDVFERMAIVLRQIALGNAAG